MSVVSEMNFKFKKSSRLFSLAAIVAIIFTAAPNAQAAQCGYANGSSYSSAPQAVGSLCVAGTAGSVTGSGPWNWTCTDGGGTVNCSSGICGVNFEWREGTFSTCDCATSLQSRGVWCYRNGVMTDPDQSGCYANAGPKPAWQQSCTPSGCVTPVAGVCDNNTVNGCSSGSAFDISSDASNDYWKCSGTNGGANSGQCQKAKPPVACIPTGQPVPPGQTQCPTNSCFFWVSGVGPNPTNTGNTTYGPSSTSKIGVTDRWYLGGIEEGGSDMVGAGDYPNSYTNPDGSHGPFRHAANGTFDGIAIGNKTRVTIYAGPNFTGGVLLDIHGPSVVSNCVQSKAAGVVGWGTNCNSWLSPDWSSYGDPIAQFTPSTRQNSGINMWSLGGNGQPLDCTASEFGSFCFPSTTYVPSSVKVTCDP